ncbi:tyrosine-type recombinase/integrase [uncultured Photobacterium sp.]|uniref:tyrosine-type recombinase/integrase n=1 Tax=uncultured Photobacterium sp. TaxID=173973 RepID=UPI00261793EF|nr:tyrosine-type recombinase/integrase [uncultured Photobacterium sp.]
MVSIGIEARESNRLKTIENVKRHTLQLLDKYFPNPRNQPTPELFENSWLKFISELEKTFGTQSDYRQAFNTAIRTVKRYREQFRWKVSPPTFLVTHKEPTQLRTLPWLKAAWAVHSFYEEWFNNGLLSKKLHDPTDIYQSMILSLIFHSGQCSAYVITAFCHELIQGPIKLQHWQNHVFATLTLEDSKLNTNCYVNDEAKTLYHCYFHPVTLGLIRLWIATNKTDWIPPKNSKELFKTLCVGITPPAHLPTSLADFCKAAIYTCETFDGVELSEALVEYRIGRTKSYALPPSNLPRIIKPKVNQALNNHFYQFKKDITIERKSLVTSSKGRTNGMPALIKQCLADNNPNQKLSPNRLRDNLEELAANIELSEAESVLIHWFIYKTWSCTTSTLRQYNANLTRKWLYIGQECELSRLSSEEIDQLYKNLVFSHKSAKSQKYFAMRLKDLHGFAVQNYSFPELTSGYFHVDAGQQHTRSGFIDEGLFSALLNNIQQLIDLNNAEKICLQALCILSYRCGLRLNELKKLQLKHIEASATGWMDIRENRFGDNKTASSLRKVPLFPLLLEHEKQIVSKHLQSKMTARTSMGNLVFTFGQSINQPFDTFLVSNFVSETLKELSGLSYLVFHHLRHSCFSRLHLLLELDDELNDIPNIVPYNKQQRHKVRYTITGKSLQNGYYSLAAFAGHESPEMTFSHYLHFSDWIAATKINKAIYSLSQKQAVQLGLSSRRHHRHLPNDLLPYLIKKLKVAPVQTIVKDGITPTQVDTGADTKIISIPVCYQVLEQYENGISIQEIAYKYRIEQETIDKWLANAHYIKSLKTKTGKQRSRHFSEAREHRLLPGKLKSAAENKLVNRAIAKLRHNYRSQKAEITEMLLYALNHTSESKSGIYFNNPDVLAQFIKTFHFMVPKSSWRAITLYHGNSMIREEWEKALQGIKQRQGKKSSPHSKAGIGAVRLELISPDEKKVTEKTGHSKHSSHLLIYLIHMMGIMMLKL